MFKFSIRDVLWLTMVVALTLGWWMDTRAVHIENSRLRDYNQQWSESWNKLWVKYAADTETYDPKRLNPGTPPEMAPFSSLDTIETLSFRDLMFTATMMCILVGLVTAIVTARLSRPRNATERAGP